VSVIAAGAAACGYAGAATAAIDARAKAAALTTSATDLVITAT